jgi:predicted O-methyltransferase YrrM
MFFVLLTKNMLDFSPEIKVTLALLEETQKDFWNISKDTGIFIHALARSMQSKKILEIGTSNGYSGIWLASALRDCGKDFFDFETMGLITVESHDGRLQLAEENFRRAGLSRFIMQVQGHAPEVFSQVKEIQGGNFDMAFLDATKSEHISYLEAILPLVKNGGIVVADNVFSHQEKMQPYVDYARSLENLSSIILPVGTGLLLSQKK